MVRFVGDYVTLQRGTTYRGDLVGEPGPALLGLGSIVPGGGFRADHWRTYGGECPAKLTLGPGDLYVALKGNTTDGSMIGSVARVPPDIASGRLTQDTAKLEFRRPDSESAKYLYWLLRTPHYRAYCAGCATGTTTVALSRDDFLRYPVPPMSNKSLHLVALFEAIEARIELNRRMNRTLESIARAIFKSWFIDFDRAQERMGDGEVGRKAERSGAASRCPRTVPLSDLAAVSRVLVPPEEFCDEFVDHYSIPAFDEGRMPAIESGGAIKSSKFAIPSGSVLVSRLNPRIPRVWLPRIRKYRAVCSTEFLVLTPKRGVTVEYLHALLDSRLFAEELASRVTGTSGSHQRVRPADALDIPVPRTGAASVYEYSAIVRPVLERVGQLREDRENLAEIRDRLLPWLLSAAGTEGRPQ